MVALPSGLEDAFGYEGLGLGCRVWACSGFRALGFRVQGRGLSGVRLGFELQGQVASIY